ncbi:TIR domain-containing protein [Veronia pacifica]|uniref:Thoeris protein ThsB TIR-like domain-containing protein n=1 Tax=Veronia pacifica TaxID=1080227 RepID=A0A1C3ESJ3_9GAMM|nr:TIR domain-containing protein [Veronia pacifica]ODA36267.1 hypothetical protein A8L45_01315 [Veronia pacifica]
MPAMLVCYAQDDSAHFQSIKSLCASPQCGVSCVSGRCLPEGILSVGESQPDDLFTLPDHEKEAVKDFLSQVSKMLVLVSDKTTEDDWVRWQVASYRETRKKPDMLFMRVNGDRNAQMMQGDSKEDVVNWNKLRLIYWLENQGKA